MENTYAKEKENIKQFYDIDRTVHFDFDYDVKPMDIIFISYDEPLAEVSYNKLKEKIQSRLQIAIKKNQINTKDIPGLEQEIDIFYNEVIRLKRKKFRKYCIAKEKKIKKLLPIIHQGKYIEAICY